jgi:hypothetical protein
LRCSISRDCSAIKAVCLARGDFFTAASLEVLLDPLARRYRRVEAGALVCLAGYAWGSFDSRAARRCRSPSGVKTRLECCPHHDEEPTTGAPQYTTGQTSEIIQTTLTRMMIEPRYGAETIGHGPKGLTGIRSGWCRVCGHGGRQWLQCRFCLPRRRGPLGPYRNLLGVR